MKKAMQYTLIGVFSAIIIFMHFYKITEVPYGLNVDEAGAAYDAFCIANYGVDRYQNSYPVYFTNFGDGQNALYIYLVAILFKLFGVSKLAIRLPIIMASFVMAVYGSLYVARKWPYTNRYLAFLGLYAVIPAFTMMQRFGLESHLMLACGTVALYYGARALESGKWQHYLLAGVSFGVTLYTYALSYIVLPVCLVILLVYALHMKKISWRGVCACAIPLGLFAAPLIAVQLINFLQLPQMEVGPFTLTRLIKYRSDELASIRVWQNLRDVFSNTLLHDDLQYNNLPQYGAMFYFSIPFIVLGFVKTIKDVVLAWKERRFDAGLPMLAWFVGELVMGAFLNGHSVPNSTRMNGIYVCWIYFLVQGILWIYDLLSPLWLKKGFAASLAVLYTVAFASFAGYYFTDYNGEVYPLKWLFFETYDEVVDLLAEHENEAWTEQTTCYSWPYVYYLLANEVNPYELGELSTEVVRHGQHYINSFSEGLMLDANYVVYKTDADSIRVLREMGYTEYVTENYHVFAAPFGRFAEHKGDEVLVNIDAKSDEDGAIVIRGWCADEASGQAFAELMVEVDGRQYPAERTERGDVVAVTGNEAYLMSGFCMALEPEAFAQAEQMVLWGILEDGSSREILRYVSQ